MGNLYKTSKNSIAAGLRYDYFAMETYGSNVNYTFLSTYGAISHSIREKTKLHLSGQYSMYWNNNEADIRDAEPSWISQGSYTALGMDINVTNRTKFVGELAYDFTYEGTRAGCAVLWGWEKFRLKFGINSYTYDSNYNFILPAFNIWWRFDG